jgi:hypothetical protein
MNAPPPMALLREAVAERGRCQYRILTGLVDKSEWRSWLLTVCLRMAASKVSRRQSDGRMSPFVVTLIVIRRLIVCPYGVLQGSAL